MTRNSTLSGLALLPLALATLAGCSHSPPQFEGGELAVLNDSTEYHLVDHDDGYEIHVFYEQFTGSADWYFDLVSLLFGVPTGTDDKTDTDNACTSRIYSVAIHYARNNGEESEFKARASDIEADIRYRTTGTGSPYRCHAYAYWRWRTN